MKCSADVTMKHSFGYEDIIVVLTYNGIVHQMPVFGLEVHPFDHEMSIDRNCVFI